jgi:hypothetical protein
MLNTADPIHDACDFLVPHSPHELLRLADVNEFLHAPDRPDPWPSFLIAFATYSCGDYYAYDRRSGQPTVIYIDPGLTVTENLSSSDKLRFGSFGEWYNWELHRHRHRSL